MAPWSRASSLDRILSCTPSAALRADPREKSVGVHEAADWGTAVHYFKQHGRLPANLLSVERFRSQLEHRCSFLNRNKLWPTTGVHELTVSVNVVTWEVESFKGPTAKEQDAWKDLRGPDCVVGTMDYVEDTPDGIWVDDLKTGRWPHTPDEPQLKFYSLAAWLLKKRPVKGTKSTITTHQRYPKDAGPERSKAYAMSPEALTAFQSVLTFTHEQILRLRPRSLQIALSEVTPGPHCTFCPAFNSCPDKTPIPW